MFNSKFARTNQVCKHGILTPNCTTCFPMGPSEVDHSGAFRLINQLQGTYEGFLNHGRKEHLTAVQRMIDEITYDHFKAHPKCKYCANLMGQRPDPAEPTNEAEWNPQEFFEEEKEDDWKSHVVPEPE